MEISNRLPIPSTCYKHSLDPKNIRGKYEADVQGNAYFRMTVYESNLTPEKYDEIKNQLTTLSDEMENPGSYDYKAAAKLTGIDIPKFAEQMKALLTASAYVSSVSFEEGDLLPTISISCKNNSCFNKDDIENIQQILDHAGIKPIFEK